MVVAFVLGVLAFISLLSDALSDRFVIGDFAQDYISAEAANAGDDPYGPLPSYRDRFLSDVEGELFPGIHVNPHPPARIALFRPLAELPYRSARIIWFAVEAAALMAAVWLLARAFGSPARWALAAAWASLLLPAAQLDLRLGHIDSILLFLLIVGWLGFKRRKDVGTGIAVGGAAALSIFPAFLLVPLLRMRRLRAIGIAALTFAMLTIIAAAPMGLGSLRRYFIEVAPSNTRTWAPDPQNISLSGIPLRWLRETFWRPEAPDLPVVAVALSILIALGCAVAAYRTRTGLSKDAFLAATPWMLLASPIAWDHYLLLAIPFVTAVMVRGIAEGRLLGRPLVALSLALVVIARLPGLTAVHPTNAIEAALWWALPGYALLLVAIMDLRSSSTRQNDHASAPSARATQG